MNAKCITSTKDYWSLYLIIKIPYAVLAVLFLDNFFLLILATLPLNNETKAASELGCDQLFILWPVTNNLTAQFQDIYMLEENLTTDKSLCSF